MTKIKIASFSALLLLVAGIGLGVYFSTPKQNGLTLYGNIDQRQVSPAFIDSERIAEVLVQEGAQVQPGQVLARLETRRLRDSIAVAEAQAASAQAILDKLRNGTRPEEIDQAKAVVASSQAELVYAESLHKRRATLASKPGGMAVSKEDVDEATLRLEVARASLNQAQKGLELALIGPRKEEIAQAEADLLEKSRNFERLRNQLSDAELTSPSYSVVSRRLMEPGDMATPQRPVFSLAVISPKWVRAYASEPSLGVIQHGVNVIVHTDSHPEEGLPGTVGFISSVAEFTPKTVQTPDLRTSLVYEVRVYVEDPENRLRLGMPATVSFSDVTR